MILGFSPSVLFSFKNSFNSLEHFHTFVGLQLCFFLSFLLTFFISCRHVCLHFKRIKLFYTYLYCLKRINICKYILYTYIYMYILYIATYACRFHVYKLVCVLHSRVFVWHLNSVLSLPPNFILLYYYYYIYFF